VKQFVVLVLVYFTMYQKMCAFRIFGDLVNYTFLETLGLIESEKTMFTFFPRTLWPPSWIFKMASVCFEIRQ